MSNRGPQPDRGDIQRGLQGLQQSSAFHGPVEPLDDHDHANDHFALIYETRDEQFNAAIPFLQQGLETGEQCLYIAHENSEQAVLDEMQAQGIDVDTALDSGQLSVPTTCETYLRDRTFDCDDMVAFFEDCVTEATEEYDALRVVAEMTWMLTDDVDIEDAIEYDSKVNRLYPHEDVIGLCQYNRNRFPPEVIRDVIATHPHLIQRTQVSHNPYYTPPEEFFGTSQPAREADRMLQTIRERTDAKAELRNQNHQLERKTDRLENFASMLAHELRNPVTIGQIYSQHLPADADSEAVEYVTEAFDRIEDMVDVMLVLAQGREAVGECTPVDLAEVVQAAWADVDATEATLDARIEQTTQADETYVRHLFRNIFENSVKHGGHNVTITVGTLPTGFYVADDGRGIYADKRDAVFKAGYTSTESHGGMGLGLAFVHELANVYDWDYAVTESESGGAQFEFTNVIETHDDNE